MHSHISGLIQEKEINEQHDLLVRLKKQFVSMFKAIWWISRSNNTSKNRKRSFQRRTYDIKTTVQSLVESMQYKGNRALFIADIAENMVD